MIRLVRTAMKLRPAAVLKLEMLSANLAIGTASAFVLVTAGVGLAIDRETPTRPLATGDWDLRGSLSRIDASDKNSRHQRDVRMRAARMSARL